MNIENPILTRLDRIEAQTSELLVQTLPRMPPLYACLLGLTVFTVVDYTLKTRDIPVLSAAYEQLTDYIGNQAASLGVAMSDLIGHVDRTAPPITAKNAIRGLDSLQTCRLRVALLRRESSGNYAHTGNWAGYIGGYQFGAAALNTVGLIRRDALMNAPKRVRQGLPPEHINFLKDDSNWTSGNYAYFLQTPALQDAAFIRLANTNVVAGFRSRALNQGNQERIAGYVAAAHLKGSSAANSWYLRGKDDHDGNGTKASTYAQLGERAINQRTGLCGDKSLIGGLLDTFTR
ncbi:hypothetical protein [Thiofilum flexile]|uniref:hypothetical protein n=1 Tax=Thiofilum flexile TaxID=125627 RepID=UPI00037A831B|nr:hypothetical protein [Thiofilum flexile]